MTGDFSVAEDSTSNNIVPALAIMKLPDLIIESISDLFLSLLAKTPADVIGKSAAEVFAAPGFSTLINALKSNNVIDPGSILFCNAGDQSIQFAHSYLKDENGVANKISLFAFKWCRNTSEDLSRENETLRQANDELRANIGYLNTITMASADVVYKMNADWTRLLELNTTNFLAPTGKPDQGWLERYIVPNDRPMILAAIKQSIEGKCMFELEHRVMQANGEEGWALSRAIPVLDQQGNITEWLGLAMDITGKKRAEQELLKIIQEAEQQRRMYETITGNTPDLVYVFDLEARFTYANEALLTMWGRTKEDSIGKSLLEVGYEPWHAAMHEKEIGHIIETHETVRGEVAFPHATLGKRIYDYILVPVLDGNGKITSIAGTTRDITEIKKLSAQKDEFLGIASHELKTPLTSVKAYGQVLQEIFQSKNDNSAVKALQRMDNQVNKLTGLIDDLLDVTRIQSGRIQFNKELFDLSALTLEILESLQLTTQKHVIEKDLDEEALFLGDKERIGQVITNLVNNAIKYSPSGGQVLVRLRNEKDHFLLSVEDFGLGIPEEMQVKVFEQFYRVNNHHQSIGGMGIGLYISSEIVNRSGGKIWVESKEGEGSTFFVSLPDNRI